MQSLPGLSFSSQMQHPTPSSSAINTPLRIAIITENFLPKVDGVTRTLCKLLEYLRDQGHQAIVLGPAGSDASFTHYAGHPLVPTHGLPLQMLGVYGDGLRLNFFRPLFVRRLIEFSPDVIHFIDPIWLGAQMMPAVDTFLEGVPRVSSYHTNLAMYASLYGFPWTLLSSTMWRLQRYLHGRCGLTFVPSPSTASALVSHGFPASCLRLWPRGIDTALFRPEARSLERRKIWGCGDVHVELELEREQEVGVDCEVEIKVVCESEPTDGEKRCPDTPLCAPELFRRESFDSGYGGSPPFNATAFQGISPNTTDFPPLPASLYSVVLPPSSPTPSSSSSLSSFPSTPHSATSSSTQETVVLLYVGRLAWEKNLRLLVESFRGILSSSTTPSTTASSSSSSSCSTGVQCKLVFVGDGPARADLERLCRDYFGDADEEREEEEEEDEMSGRGRREIGKGRVVFEGQRSGAELAEMYASADVSVFPSYTETFGQVVLEALASGLPVVGLKAEGVRDLVQHDKTGLLLDLDDLPRSSTAAEDSLHTLLAPDSPAFASAVSSYRTLLLTLIRDPVRRRRMGKEAVTSVEGWRWEEAMERVVKGYREVVEDGRARRVKEEMEMEMEKGMEKKVHGGDGREEDVPGPAPWSTKQGSRRWSLPLMWVFSRFRPRGARVRKYARPSRDSDPDAEDAALVERAYMEMRDGARRHWLRPRPGTMTAVGTGAAMEVLDVDREAQRAILRSEGSRVFLSVARRYGASSIPARTVIFMFLIYTVFSWAFFGTHSGNL